MKYDYLIVGSGFSGAVFAREAARRGKKCLVVEKREHIGGNCYTCGVEGIQVHRYGAHIFHTNSREVWQYVNDLGEFLPFINSPIANYKGELYNLPFNMNTFAQMWGVRTPAEARERIAAQRGEAPGEPENLEEQAISLVGRDIYDKLVKGYTEKQWGRACRSLPPFIIKRLPVRFTFDNNYFSHRYQGIPQGGYTPLFERLLGGCDLALGTDFLSAREEYAAKARKVVYTGPLDAYFGYRYGALEYRSLSFEDEILDTDNYQGVAVMNFTDGETPYTRIIEHKHFEAGTQPRTVITREYPRAWAPGAEPYYPVNDAGNQALYARYARLAEEESGTIFLGRLARYQYIDMDQTIAAALRAAGEELGERE